MTGHEDRIAARGPRGVRLRGRTSTRSVAMVLLGGLAMERAVGTSLLVIAMQSTAGFLGHRWRVDRECIDECLFGDLVHLHHRRRVLLGLGQGFCAADLIE